MSEWWTKRRNSIDELVAKHPWRKAHQYEINCTRHLRALYNACLLCDYKTIGYLIYTGRVTTLDFPCFCNRFLRIKNRHSFLNHLCNLDQSQRGQETLGWIFYFCDQANIVITPTEQFWDMVPVDKLPETILVFLNRGGSLTSLLRLLDQN